MAADSIEREIAIANSQVRVWPLYQPDGPAADGS
jgi:hypothetical protein